MNAPMPAMGKSPAESHGKTLFAALLLGILCTLCIYTYSTNNLDVLGLSPESQKARTLEIIVLLIGQTFLSFTIGKVYENNPAWAYKLGFILVILFIVDFASSYQARNAINQHQTLTKSASEEHAKLIAAQIGVAQNTAKELTDSAERQRNNKFITAGAANANKAAKQADSAAELIKLHGEAIKSIKPTEADTFGAWTGNIIFMSMLGLYLLNDAMWAFIGHFVGRGNKHHDSHPFALTPTVVPEAPTIPALDVEAARETVRQRAAAAGVAGVLATGGGMAQAAEPPPAPPSVSVPDWEHPQRPTVPNREQLQKAKQTGAGVPMPLISYSINPHPVGVADVSNRKQKHRETVQRKQQDTGTDGVAGHRYNRIKKSIQDKKLTKVGIREFMRTENMRYDVASGYVAKLEADGLVKRKGKGWVVV